MGTSSALVRICRTHRLAFHAQRVTVVQRTCSVVQRHYTGSLACVPSRPTLFTGQYPTYGVTQTDGLGKMADDSRMRCWREGEVPTRSLVPRPAMTPTTTGMALHPCRPARRQGRTAPTNTAEGEILHDNVDRYLDANPLDPFRLAGWARAYGGLLRIAVSPAPADRSPSRPLAQ